MFKHFEDDVQELAHDGDQGLESSFAARQQALVEAVKMGLMLRGQ